MCGIAGIWSADRPIDGLVDRLEAAGKQLQHRGPDGGGIWCHALGLAGLVHRRLAVLDLRDVADQPMRTGDDRHHLVFNGEIYNYLELRTDRAMVPSGGWRTTGDTEVLLQSLAARGVQVLDQLDGMFAFGLYDQEEHTITIARDRFGEKPLFVSVPYPGCIVFGSTLPAVMSLLGSVPEVDPEQVALYWKQNAVAGPATIYTGVQCVPPGGWLEGRGELVREGRYWEPSYPSPTSVKRSDVLAETRERLLSSLRRRLASDVPVGCFLSGGVDSSLVTALVAQEFRTTLDTFSVGFADVPDPDAIFAREVSRRYATRHHSMVIDESALEELPSILWHVGQPFGDFSCIPTFIVAREARKQVTVALTGDGADEIFGGYMSVRSMLLADKMRKTIPAPLRKAAALMSRSLIGRHRGSRLRRIARFLQMTCLSPGDAYDLLYGRLDVGGFDLDAPVAPTWRERYIDGNIEMPVHQLVLNCELRGRMVDNFLVKVDTASMAHALETRTPYLSKELFDVVASIPSNVLLRNGETKSLLKGLAEDYLSKELLYRPKVGFSPPLGRWLRKPRFSRLIGWILSDRSPAAEWIDLQRARHMWDVHQGGRQNYQSELFAILAYCIWHQLFVEQSLSPTDQLSQISS